MARAAIEHACPDPPLHTVLELRNTVWAVPVMVTDQKEVRISVSTSEDDLLNYEIYSSESESKTVHCQGEAAFVQKRTTPRVDVARLRKEMAHSTLNAADVYGILNGIGLQYGPSHQGIARIDLNGNELAARLHLPATCAARRSEYVLHPSVMDSALQSTIGLIVKAGPAPSAPVMPFAVGSVCIFAPCVDEMIAWVRHSENSSVEQSVLTFDIDLCDLGGSVCVELRDLSLRILGGKTVTFDEAFYQKLIADVSNHQVTADEALALS
ncbi:MAG: polyketide synthase dehydratase domain-containing protein [Terracidiphilus sp.]|jgi:polyketide synthase PksN